MKKIGIHLAEGFEEIEAITVIDVLRRAGLDVCTISISEEKNVTGAHHIPVIADQLYTETDYNELDMIILPGGMPGAKNLLAHEGLKKQILTFNNDGKWLGAICAAPMVFGQLGILKGKNAVCYPGFEIYLTDASLRSEPVAVAEKIITGNGIGGALAFSLKIVELLDSPEKSEELAKAMLYF